MAKARGRSRTGVCAAIAATVVFGTAGIASAAQDETITADDSTVFTPSEVTIDVGESVTWTFANPTNPHNVVAKPDSPTPWSTGDGFPVANHPNVGPITFDGAGTYTFQCQAHGGMEGRVIVGDGGDPPPPPPPPPPPASPPPPGDTHPITPAPSGGTDTVKPTVRKLRAKALRHAVRVRFRLSEPATVTVRIKRRGSRKVLKSARVQAAAGTRTVTLRSKRLKKGRYVVEIQARDALGNRSKLATKRLALRR
jgi:plastocyanin